MVSKPIKPIFQMMQDSLTRIILTRPDILSQIILTRPDTLTQIIPTRPDILTQIILTIKTPINIHSLAYTHLMLSMDITTQGLVRRVEMD
jgi:hypothetical protein